MHAHFLFLHVYPEKEPGYLLPNKILWPSKVFVNHGTKPLAFEIKILNAILCVVTAIPFDKKCHSEYGHLYLLRVRLYMCYAVLDLCI